MKLIDLLVQELPKRGGWPGDNAPGFYSFLENNNITFEFDFDCAYFKNQHGDTVNRAQYETALAASQKVEWDGNGLPPLGVDAEVSVDGGRTWCSYKAVKEHNGMRLVEIGDFTEEFQSNNWSFRPISSEADKKRYAAANAMCKVQEFPAGEITPDGVARGEGKLWVDVYDAIAAGKIPGVRIE